MNDTFPTRPLIGLLLRLAYQHHAQEIEAALAGAGFDDIRPSAANVFPFLSPGGSTVSELAELAHVRKQTMAQAVEQLERTGYVERRPNPRDRRSQLVFLTSRGAAVPPVTHAAAAQAEGRWAQLLGPEELEALRASLTRLVSELRGPEGLGSPGGAGDAGADDASETRTRRSPARGRETGMAGAGRRRRAGVDG